MAEEVIVCNFCLCFDSDVTGDYFVSADCGHLYHYECINKAERTSETTDIRCSQDRKIINRRLLRKLPGVEPKKNPLSNKIPQTQCDYSFKIAVVGDAGVGKSSLLDQFINKSFNRNSLTTVGDAYRFVTTKNGGQICKLNITDTAGQERFRSLVPIYMKKTQGVLLVYDITDRNTFNGLRTWLEFIREHATYPEIELILVGNKLDLKKPRDSNHVSENEGKKLAELLGASFYETSALAATNVEAVFQTLTTQILQNGELLDGYLLDRAEGSITLSNIFSHPQENIWQKWKAKCCSNQS